MARNLCRLKRAEDDDVVTCEAHDVHVLAVDDSIIDRKVIERLLKISSCKVTAVDSGRRALQFLGLDEEKSPVSFDGLKVDMIITDYCMPGMTGYELLKKIKGSSYFREIPVVIMSSENVLARIDRCLEEGAEDFIVKPVKLSDVKRLKDYMFGDERLSNGNKGINKRKEPEPLVTSSRSSDPSDLSCLSSKPSDSSLLSSQPSIDSSCPSPCTSPHDTTSESSSPTLSPPLCSPTRRLKMTNCD